jgi:uncharacterized protein YciI
MLFVFTGTDKPGSLDLRVSTRPDHVEFLMGLVAEGTVKLAGPFVDAEGKPCGSMVVLEAESAETATAILARDPYAIAGLFGSTEIRGWNWTIGKPA